MTRRQIKAALAARPTLGVVECGDGCVIAECPDSVVLLTGPAGVSAHTVARFGELCDFPVSAFRSWPDRPCELLKHDPLLPDALEP